MAFDTCVQIAEASDKSNPVEAKDVLEAAGFKRPEDFPSLVKERTAQ